MPRIETHADFNTAVADLPLDQQHHLAKHFIAGVMHLGKNPRLGELLELLKQPGCSPEALQIAHTVAQTVYIETGPGSDLAEVDFNCQATHFIAQAVLACSTPDSKATSGRLARKVANYCRMAQTCSSMGLAGEAPDFASAEAEYNRVVREQFDIVSQLLESQAA